MILNLSEHIVAQPFSFFKVMFEGQPPWTEIDACCNEKDGIRHGKADCRVLVTSGK
mgnify:CR=1 FL=1